MKKPILLCNVTVAKIEQRGKTIRYVSERTIRMVTTARTIAEMEQDEISMQFLASNFFKKTSSEEATGLFRTGYSIRRLEVEKEVGYTHDRDSEWL
jgi:hypothetical protein